MSFPARSTWWQILFWGGLWASIPVLLSGNPEYVERLVWRGAVVFVGIALVVWMNLDVLLPRLYFNKKITWYILAGLVLITVVVLVTSWESAPWAEVFARPGDRSRPPGPGSRGMHSMKYIGFAMPYFTAFLGSALFEMSRYANRKEKEAAELRNEKLEAELKFLKSQINPHFLFNALNNIYTLTVIKSDQAPDHLLKLSGMLRYMLYECKADRVPLQKEIEYLRHYIDLHLLKDSRGLNVAVDLDESRPHLSIAPMILIPFVENAFKHSKVEDRTKGWIRINLRTDDGEIRFEVQNSMPEQPYTKDMVGGIGLSNVRRQLELLYPGRHELQIEQENAVFSVHLRIWSA